MKKQFDPLESLTQTHIPTAQAAFYLNYSQSRMRLWSSTGSGPLKPSKVGRKLLWPVSEIRALLGLA